MKNVLPQRTVGMDLGDRYSYLHILDELGECVEEGRLRTTPQAMTHRFGAAPAARIVIEAGTHSPWVSRLLDSLGHEVFVANPRRLRAIYDNDAKSDRVDAEYLARIGRLDPQLLRGIQHRSEETQACLAVIKARDTLVRTRTRLVVHCRGMAKALGTRFPTCSTASFHRKAPEHVPLALRPALAPLLEMIEQITTTIRAYDREIQAIIDAKHPECRTLQQVTGVGSVTSLTFALVIEDPARFRKSRDVGAYIGMVPRRQDSGDSTPQLRITKAGDPLLRRLLVQSAAYILGPHGPDSDLRRYGERIAARGGKNARKRSRVAVARKLAVILHRLWASDATYEPLYNSNTEEPPIAA